MALLEAFIYLPGSFVIELLFGFYLLIKFNIRDYNQGFCLYVGYSDRAV